MGWRIRASGLRKSCFDQSDFVNIHIRDPHDLVVGERDEVLTSAPSGGSRILRTGDALNAARTHLLRSGTGEAIETLRGGSGHGIDGGDGVGATPDAADGSGPTAADQTLSLLEVEALSQPGGDAHGIGHPTGLEGEDAHDAVGIERIGTPAVLITVQ